MKRRLLFLSGLIVLLMGLITALPITRNEAVPQTVEMTTFEGSSITLLENDNFTTMVTDFNEGDINRSTLYISALEGGIFHINYEVDGKPEGFNTSYGLSRSPVPQMLIIDRNELEETMLFELTGCHFDTLKEECLVLAHVVISQDRTSIIVVDVEGEYIEESNLKALYFTDRIFAETVNSQG